MRCDHARCGCDSTPVHTESGTFCCESCAGTPTDTGGACGCPHDRCVQARSYHPRTGRRLDIGPTAGGACAQA